MTTTTTPPQLAFIGGGNMASAIIGGLLQQGMPADHIQVVEPVDEQRSKLTAQFGIAAQATPNTQLAKANLVIWAVKPQTFQEAALQVRNHTTQALHLSVAAGIRSSSIANWLGTQRIVRAMPNTPTLIGRGITGLFARSAVTAQDRLHVEQVLQPTGQYLWLNEEKQLDAVTALSGSGPAYVFYFLEAMVQAGTAMGLTPEQAKQLATSTFAGATELARTSSEPLQLLRERVTSKGGTTYAALSVLEENHVLALFVQAMQAARQRAQELGDVSK